MGPPRLAAVAACAPLIGACGPAGPGACPPGSVRASDGLCHLSDPADTGDTGAPAAAGPPPSWTPAEVEAAAKAALALGLPEPVRVRDLYAEALSHADGGCPAREDQTRPLLTGVWFDDCGAADGTRFNGLGIFDEGRGEASWSFEGVANFVITGADGRVFSGGGEFALDSVADGDDLRWFTKTGGVFHLDGSADWLGGLGDVGLFAEGAVEGGARAVQLDGGAVLAGASVAFRGLTVDESRGGGLPEGELLLRDPSGHWWALPFPGGEACAPLRWHGEPTGEALCVGAELAAAALRLHDAGVVP